MTSRPRIRGAVWMIAYVAVIGAVVGSLLSARRRALDEMNTPQARAEWETWRQSVRDEARAGAPVQRRVPKSGEPPMVVLMRDHFAVCLATAVVLSSALFTVMAFMLEGVLRGRRQT